MAMLKPSCVRDLRSRVNLVDVISRTVTLRKAGSRFKGLCPFHQEKSPSFHVNPDMGVYKCFGCGKSGDLITFVRETEGLNFVEAVETLAQRYHVTLEYEEGRGPTAEERSVRSELYALHDAAAAYYHEVFRSSQPAGEQLRRYWQEERRFDLVIAEDFKIGAAPPRDDTLAARLMKQGFSEDALRQCGLFFIRDNALLAPGNLRARFRGRLMIPIRDHQGRVVAFTARQTTLTPEDDPAREAKYVNSPETPIFTKGNLLFNLDRAKEDAARLGHAFVLVEGQLDAIRAWSVGVHTAIAPQGTAITESQLALLRRYHHQVDCFFDRDSAGQTAALRFLPMALQAGLETRFLTVPGDGKLDPDLLFLERGRAGYEELTTHALSAMAFACQSLLPDPPRAGAEQKARAAQELFPIIAATDSAVARSEFVQEAAVHLNLSAVALAGDFARFQPRGGARRDPPPDSPAPLAAAPTAIPPERDLLLICLHFEELGPPLSRSLPHDWIATDHPAGVLLNRFLAEFEHDTWPGRAHLDTVIETDEERTLIADLLFTVPSLDDPPKAILEGMHRLRDRALLPRLREIELALATAHIDGQLDPFSLLRERSHLQRLLRQPLQLA